MPKLPSATVVLLILLLCCFVTGSQPNRAVSSSVSPAHDSDSIQKEPLKATNSNSVYYTLRPDMRRCATPMCGGYFVKQVNQPSTKCFDGKIASECYVAEIDWAQESEIEPNKALLRGELKAKAYPNFGKLGIFHVLEAWQAPTDKAPAGTFYRVQDRGVRCITYPCQTHLRAKLNSSLSGTVAGVDLQGVAVDSNEMAQASQAMTGKEGVLVAATEKSVSGPGGKANTLVATQFYLRARKTAALKPCIRTGCSNQICAESEVISTCEFKPEYECYKTASCERQADGNCGFTKTPELTACKIRLSKSGD